MTTPKELLALNDFALYRPLSTDQSIKPKDLTPTTPAWFLNIGGILLSISIMMSLVINGLYIFVYSRNKKLRNCFNLVILCLSVINIATSLVCVLMVATSYFAHKWVFGHNGCIFNAYVGSLLGLSSITLLTILAIIRYFIVMKQRRISSNKTTLLITAGGVLFAIGWSSMPLIGWGGFQIQLQDMICGPKWKSKSIKDISYVAGLVFFFFCVPVTVMTFSYVQILRKVKRQTITAKYTCEAARLRKIKRQRQLTTTVVLMIGVFLLSWSPYVAISLWTLISDSDNIHYTLTSLAIISAKFSTVWSSLLYVYRNPTLRTTIYNQISFTEFFRERQERQTRETNHIVNVDQNSYHSTSCKLSPRPAVVFEERKLLNKDVKETIHRKMSINGYKL